MVDVDLAGSWAAAEADDALRRTFPRPELDDKDWAPVPVPGHWRSSPHFAVSDGPVLYRRHFTAAPPGENERAWLVMDGAFYQSDVWMDGSYLGDAEGYFFPHTFDVTGALRERSDHLLAVEVGCEPAVRPGAKRALMGAWSDETSIDPSYNPGGIWAPVKIVSTGPVRVASLRLSCPEATTARAVLELSALLDASSPVPVKLLTEVRSPEDGEVVVVAEKRHSVARGQNRARWRVEVPSPRLWWPADLGGQPLYEVVVSVEAGGAASDAVARRTGLRQVRAPDFRFSVNGEPLFLKGANLVPTRRELGAATAAEVARDITLAREAGLNLLRVRAHVGRPELYDAADEAGLLLWQDMPLHGSFRGPRRQAVRQAAKAVELLGHHPSLVFWCSHNEPFPSGPTGPGWAPGRSLRRVAAQVIPNPRRSVVDQSVGRAIDRADGSRPVVPSAGVLPHLARASASHLYFGWYHGLPTDLARAARIWPAAVRFVAELGGQSVPAAGGPLLDPEKWPDFAWDELARRYCLQRGVLEWRTPTARYKSLEAWRRASQERQAELVRCEVESLRRLARRPTGGFTVHFLGDAQPAVSCSLLDHERTPKLAWSALAAACAEVIVVADYPRPRYALGQQLSLAVHVVNDSREALVEARVEARLSWPGGGRSWLFTGDAQGRVTSFVAKLACVLPGERELPPGRKEWPLSLDLVLRWGDRERSCTNRYSSSIVAHR